MNSLRTLLAARKANAAANEKGFSLIDVVVTVAVIVALSVGGFVTFNGLINNAKQSAVDYAAVNVYKAAAAYESDGNDDTTACSAVDEYNTSSSGITVSLIVPDESDPKNESLYQYYPAAGSQTAYSCS